MQADARGVNRPRRARVSYGASSRRGALLLEARLETNPGAPFGDEELFTGRDTSVIVRAGETVQRDVLVRPTDKSHRIVTLSGTVALKDCDCCFFQRCPDYASRSLFISCETSPGKQGHFKVTKDQLCDDEVGVEIEGTCTLVPGSLSVRVEGVEKFYESVEGSCGADSLEDDHPFLAEVPASDEGFPPAPPTPVSMPSMENGGTCFYSGAALDCSDHADWRDVQIVNTVASF